MDEALKQWWADILTVLNYSVTLGNSQISLISIFKLLVIVALLFVVERFLRSFLRRRVLSRTHLDPDLQFALSRFAGYCFIAIGLFFAFKVIHLDLSAFAVMIGALGVGIGFGLQNIVSNFISGLVILAERPIALGHRVEVGGVAGRVTQINLRSTTVVTNDNITIIVPNSHFITEAVTNWSHGDPKVRLRLPVGVAYGSDVEKLRKVLLEVAAENPSALKEPAPAVRFLEFGDSSLNFELAVWTIEMAHQPARFRSDLYFAIERKLRENQIEIPFPQRDLHLRSGKITLETKSGGRTDVKLETYTRVQNRFEK
ncbi:MAG TPA: mechanosensitive ion channel domain-containing protein [Candidatus Binatia bacterium]|nr:mechanosensitive ion channel domain-containing protein [Candidatus Binatia bacterium]